MKTPKSWLTGDELMAAYDLPAADLGRLCHEGMLSPRLPEILKPIYDLSLIPKIPKYWPLAVRPQKYIRRGETVRWDWEACPPYNPRSVNRGRF